MSDRDKKLLVYLGALIILAAAYFLVGRPFLDKINLLSAEKIELQSELDAKREALKNKAVYEQGIEEANTKIREIIDEFPEDNTDEKTIMFVANAERAIPAWFAQIKFSEETENTVAADNPPAAEGQPEQGENPADIQGDQGQTEAGNDAETESGAGSIRDLSYRDTEIGLKITTKYDGFKKWLAYTRDYEDRIVIKDIDVTYDENADLVSGTLTLSQYALLGPGRELPPVETAIEDLGKKNVFVLDDYNHTFIDLIGEIASDLFEAIIGGVGGLVSGDSEDYFINVNASTDNTSAKTVGRAKDPAGTTYLTSNTNDKEDISFTLKGSDGRYTCEYELGGYTITDDEFQKDITGNVVLRIISSSRAGKDDRSAISLHLRNLSDIPLVVNIENDDTDNPRIDITSKDGDIVVND